MYHLLVVELCDDGVDLIVAFRDTMTKPTIPSKCQWDIYSGPTEDNCFRQAFDDGWHAYNSMTCCRQSVL